MPGSSSAVVLALSLVLGTGHPDPEVLAREVLALSASGDPVRLARLLEIRLEGTPVERRPALLAEIASLRERAGDRAGAFAARLRGFGEAAARGDVDPAARADLERLAGDPAAWEAIAQGGGPATARAWIEVAKIREHLLADRAGALAATVAAERAAERSRLLGLIDPGLAPALAHRHVRLGAWLHRNGATGGTPR
jgi:hypothetical protein